MVLRVTNTCGIRLTQATVLYVYKWTSLSNRTHKRHTVTHTGSQMLQDVEISYRIIRDTITTHVGRRHVRARKGTAQWEPTAGGNFNLGTTTPHILGRLHITTLPPYTSNRFTSFRLHQLHKRVFCQFMWPNFAYTIVVPGTQSRLLSVPEWSRTSRLQRQIFCGTN
jgi:hypothetical protein